MSVVDLVFQNTPIIFNFQDDGKDIKLCYKTMAYICHLPIWYGKEYNSGVILPRLIFTTPLKTWMLLKHKESVPIAIIC